MALADSSNNDLVERMIRVEDALAHQIELSRVAFTELHRRIEFAVDQFEKRLDQIGCEFALGRSSLAPQLNWGRD